MKNQTKILSDERGIGLIVEIILGAIALAVIGFAVMTALKVKDGGTGTSLIPAKVTLNGKCEFNDTDLCKFVNNWKTMKNYSMTAVQTDKDGKKSESLFEIAGENKSHIQLSTNGKAEYDMIYIDNTSYLKDFSDGKWWKNTTEKSTQDKTTSEFEFKTEDDAKDEPAAAKTQYKLVTKEACGKLKCFKYQVIEPGTAGTQYIWFDDRDYLLRRMQQSDAESGTSDMTFAYTKPVIVAPSPVKDGTPSQPAMPTDIPFEQ